ncbi:MAG: tetratricopeptide repeat protein [Bacteroidales bacterium]|nr:tetratricopeptide repeat protein [Bacteroidales bacterium]
MKLINKNIFYLIFLILLSIHPTFGKKLSKTDSLKNVLKIANNDSIKIIILNELCWEYKNSNPDSAICFCNKALAFGKNANNKNLIARTYNNFGNIYSNKGEYETSVKYYIKALNIYKKTNNQKGLGDVYNNIGIIYTYQGDFDKALEYYNKSLRIDIKMKSKNLAKSYSNIGVIYFYKGDYCNALNNFLECLKIEEKHNIIEGMSYTYNNIGEIYAFQKDYTNALKYYNKSLKIKKEINDINGLASAYFNIGDIYIIKNEFQKALEYNIIALENRKQIDDKNGITNSYIQLGKIYNYLKQYNKALIYLNKSLILAKKIGYPQGIANANNNLGITNINKKKYKTAISHLLKAYEIGIKIKAPLIIKTASNNLSQAYSNINNYQDAYKFHVIYKQISDSANIENHTKKITELEMQYEFDKKQKIKKLKDKQLALAHKAELKRQKIIKNSFIGFSFFTLLVAFFIFRIYRIKKKTNEALEYKNIEIFTQKEEIIAQAKELEITNNELEKLSIVASETDNGVMIMDAEGKIEWLNEGYTKMLGYTLNDLLKEKGDNLLKVSAYKNIKDVFRSIYNSKNPKIYESENITKSGEKKWVQTTITPILNNNKEIRKLISIDSNITKLKNVEKEIIDSIVYAKRIQNALSPSKEILIKTIHQYFILNKPKGIVSGDFYWFSEIKNKIIIAVADCTGHGVPGAFMSMLGVTLLNKIVNEKGIIKPNEILDRLRNNVIISLHQTGEVGEANDGMDIALITIDKKNNYLEYAGANNSAYLFRNNELTEIFADKMPIGICQKTGTPFSCRKMSIQTEDIIYLFTDGYADQFGGENEKKFMYKNFKILLKKIHNLPMNEQETSLFKTHKKWKGNNEQVDDILIMGIKI